VESLRLFVRAVAFIYFLLLGDRLIVIVLPKVVLVVTIMLWHQRKQLANVLLTFLGPNHAQIEFIGLKLHHNFSDSPFKGKSRH
jgi:hypothetical protein